VLLLTNYRLFLLMHDSTSFINVPVMLVESIEVKDIFFIYIYLKVAKTIRVLFSSNEKAVVWATRINAIINRLYKLEELFSFAFYSWLTNEPKPLMSNTIAASTASDECAFLPLPPFAKCDQANLIYKEFKRMRFDSKLWRISEVNKKFE
jgi:myotubularin-related protein 3/4